LGKVIVGSGGLIRSKYHGQGLDAEHEGVRGHVARVGEGIFLPELGKEGLGGGDVGVVEDKIAYANERSRRFTEGACVVDWHTLEEEMEKSA
jgi:hypothetical protein